MRINIYAGAAIPGIINIVGAGQVSGFTMAQFVTLHEFGHLPVLYFGGGYDGSREGEAKADAYSAKRMGW